MHIYIIYARTCHAPLHGHSIWRPVWLSRFLQLVHTQTDTPMHIHSHIHKHRHRHKHTHTTHTHTNTNTHPSFLPPPTPTVDLITLLSLSPTPRIAEHRIDQQNTHTFSVKDGGLFSLDLIATWRSISLFAPESKYFLYTYPYRSP